MIAIDINFKILQYSVNFTERRICYLAGSKLPFPIIADENRSLATKLGMMDPDECDEKGATLTARCVGLLFLLRSIFMIFQNKEFKLCFD